MTDTPLAPHQCNTIDDAVAMLAGMRAAEADPWRKTVANQFEVRLSTLDEMVFKARKSIQDTDADPFGWEVEPAKIPISTAKLLDEIEATIRKHIVLSKDGAAAIALWILHAWIFDAFDVSPLLSLTSPEKRCGKTTLLGLVTGLAPKPLPSSNCSGSTVFRAVEEWRPTLIIDEADTFLENGDEIRGILNSGHTKYAAFVLRQVEGGDDGFKTKRFSTWAPKVIAKIGTLPDTLADRSIIVEMKRKAPGERVEKLRNPQQSNHFLMLRECLCRWATDNQTKLTTSVTNMPEGLNDRAADNWEVLISIADHAGGDWPMKARTAATALSGEEASETDSVKTLLLSDIRDLFVTKNTDRLTSAAIVEHLATLDHRRWPEWKGGRPMSKVQLARLLGHFKIRSGTIRFSHGTDKGYYLSSFAETFERYLIPLEASQRYNPHETATPEQNGSVTANGCDVSERGQKPASIQRCDVVTDQQGVSWEEPL
jgi:putative DNA primase/helicase